VTCPLFSFVLARENYLWHQKYGKLRHRFAFPRGSVGTRCKTPFSIGLPNSFTSSKENVEYSFEYQPINETNFGGEFTIYIGVGGL